MSERDCGKWYCQRAAGFKRLVIGEDVLIYPGERAPDHDRRKLDEERAAIKVWMEEQRSYDPDVWLAAFSHGNGAAKHYWVWDPDSRGHYFEANGDFGPDDIPEDFGDMHRGLGWQLPLLAVFRTEPEGRDLEPLERNHVPYVVLDEEPVDPPECDPEIEDCDEEEDECPPCEPCPDPMYCPLEELDEILDDALDIARDWKGGKHRRDLRKYVIRPLRKLLEG
jgi:hypothetical protein